MKLLLVLLVVLLFTVSGTTGEEVQACFKGSSYIKYDVLHSSSKPIGTTKDEITLKFRSSDASGLLFYADSRGLYGDHILLQLVNGKLRIRYQLGQNSTLKEDIIGDGLGDDIISTVTVKRTKKKLEIAAFGGQSDKKVIYIPGADDRLDLNGNIYVGGYLNPKQDFPSQNKVNFKGCMITAVFNKIDLLYGARFNKKGFSKSKNLYFTDSPSIPSRPMNFQKETYMQIKIQRLETSDSSLFAKQFYGWLTFRTILIAGTIFEASAVTLTFQKSQLLLKSGSADLIALSFPNSGYASDGRWFEVKYFVTNNEMRLTLNNVTKRIKPFLSPQYGGNILFGYNQKEFRFVGCIRDINVQGNRILYTDVIDPYRENRIATYDELSEGCKASDPCIPNPCFHEGDCMSYAKGINCECKKKYKLPYCQFSQYKTTCSAIKKDGSVASLEANYFIDPDDSGPESPVKVKCNFIIRKDSGQTEIETVGAEQQLIENPSNYKNRFSFKKEIKYEIPLSSVKAIVDRSQTCEQLVKYECLNAKLFNQPGGVPSSRWLSANGYLQYYWGGAPPNSYKCACVYSPKGCTDSERFCNCDSAAAEGTANSDEGLLNVTRDLPVREVQFGGLDSISRATYTVRRVVCYGVDTLGVVTFVAPDGWLRLDPWNSPIGGDISLYIKTIFPTGSLIDHRNSDENHMFIVSIVDATTIGVVFSLGTSVRTKYFARMENGLGTLSDNKWHKIHIIRTLWDMIVKIDDRPTTVVGSNPVKYSIALSGDARSRLDIALPMFVGAFWRFPTYRKGYVGCMKGFTVNGKVIDLEIALDHLTHEPEALVIKGCGNACRVNQCPYGKCIEGYTSYSCDCSDVPFYGKYCNQEYGVDFRELGRSLHSAEINVTTGWSKAERMVLAFSTKPESTCSGTLFEILSENQQQYYKLVLISNTVLELEFKLVSIRDPVKKRISLRHVEFCDTTRHTVFIERNSTNWINYKIDGRPMVETEYKDDATGDFVKPYFFYVGNNKRSSGQGGQFSGCISGAKFHLSLGSGIKTVEPIIEALATNATGINKVRCGPSINTPSPVITRRVPGPTTPTDYPSTEFLRDVGIHEAEDSNWAVLIVVALLMMLCLVALVVLTIWFVMHHKNDYQILEKEDGTVVGTATVRGGNASLASVPAGANGAGNAPSRISQGNLSRAKSKSNDVFV